MPPLAPIALLACAALAASSLSTSSLAQTEPRMTSWRGIDGLPQSGTLGVTVSPRGRIVTIHSPSLPVAHFDGFSVTTNAGSVGAPGRVHESRSEQLWCVAPEGLYENTGAGWKIHPIPEIAAEFRGNPLRSVRPVPLVPLDRNRVLFLLPDRLFEYDATDHRTTPVRAATATSVGRFIEMNPSRDDGAWITGTRGLLRVTAPLRHIRPDTPFEEIPVPEALEAVDLQRPFENRRGDIVMTAEDRRSRERIVLRFSQGRWTRWNGHGQNFRQAWADSDGSLWAHTSGTVFRLGSESEVVRPIPVLQVGRVADVALDGSGAAWIATSEGLFRLAPLPWRPVAGFDPSGGTVVGIRSDRRGRLVAASAQSFHWMENGSWSGIRFTAPAEEDVPRTTEMLFPLLDGSVLVRSGDTNLVFFPESTSSSRSGPFGLSLLSERVAATTADVLARARPIALLPDGRLVFQSTELGTSNLLAFDGSTALVFSDLPADHHTLGTLHVVVPTRTGELLLGGTQGVAIRRAGQWRRFENVDGNDAGPTFDGAWIGMEAPDGKVLVGGSDAVREFDGVSWRVLRRGLDQVHGILAGRDGTLWIASGSGLHRFRDRSWFVLGEEEGLPSGAVYSVFADGSGQMWAATARGMYAFDPNSDPDPPRAEITDADLPTGEGENRTRFVIGGRDQWRYAPAGRLLFSWRLDNGPWSPWRAMAQAQFTDLMAGAHRFEARAMDPSGNVSDSTAIQEFMVVLPWFRDPRLVYASIALAFLLVALAAQGVHGYRRLKLSYAEVGRQVAERSAALERANAELLHSHKMRALGTLAAGVAHDFNNLLSIIKGSAQLLESQLHDPEKSRQRLLRIRTAVDQGAGLVRAMLGYSREAPTARKTVDPAEIVAHAIRLLEERHQGRLSFLPPPPPPPSAYAQPEMLQQVLLNLIQNADEAMDQRGIVEISLESSELPPENCWLKPEPAPRYISVLIRDRGVGIPPENLPRIFEPFFTTKGFSSRRGTGLGLSMVYEFTKEMGAGIAVTSTVGQGTSFRVVLPAAPTLIP